MTSIYLPVLDPFTVLAVLAAGVLVLSAMIGLGFVGRRPTRASARSRFARGATRGALR